MMLTKRLWQPSQTRIKQSNMAYFIDYVNSRCNESFSEYEELREWAISEIPKFWNAMWEFAGIKTSRPFDRVVDDVTKMPGAKWFVGAKMNFAENLLRFRDDRTAMVFRGENGSTVPVTYAALYEAVARLAKSLRSAGVQRGDRVAGFMPNVIETVVAMLAATSIGAVWSSCSPDFGIKGVLDRFGQIEPKILFAADGYQYNGKKFDCLGRMAEILEELPSIERTVIVLFAKLRPEIGHLPGAVYYEDFLADERDLKIDFEQVPADHPLYIMYSSGTTGLPKCMVQSVGGILVQHLKELILHTDLKRESRIFYFTTCGWMMWNWLVSSLAVGATVVLFDGSPFYPDPGVLWRIAEEERLTVFGTSAKYLDALEKSGEKPQEKYDLSTLQTICSTGSPLSTESFEYVYRDIKEDVLLASISGGTDLNGCFALGNPSLPVYAGQLQCRGLGMNVHAFDANGRSIVGQKGELVCTSPFPSMPLFFWNDQDGQKYHEAYFDVYPGVWRHGDFIEITPNGGMIIYGRSDATLNPGGVRIGTAEIYRQVEALEEIVDSVVIDQDFRKDVRVVLFVKMNKGIVLTEEVKNKIRMTIRENVSPHHVPAKIIAVPDIPYTINMKKVELAVKQVIKDQPVENREALANPESLEHFRDLKELES